MESEADTTLYGKDGKTALVHAIVLGLPNIVDRLILYNASLNIQDTRGKTALIHAACNTNCYFMKVLLEEGVNVNVQDSYGCTALYHAAYRGNKQAVSMLLDYDAKTTIANIDEHTIFSAAIKNGNLETVELLLGYFDVDFQDMVGCSYFFFAVSTLNLGIIGLLLGESPDVNKMNKEGYSPLTYARSKGNAEVISMLENSMITSNLSSSWEYV